GVGVILDAADDGDVASLRVLETEAVVAVRLLELGRRIDGFETVRDDLRVQRVNGFGVCGTKHHADQRRLGSAPQRYDVMESAGAAQVMHAIAGADMAQIPYVGEKTQRLARVGKTEIDAAQRADFRLAHLRPVKIGLRFSMKARTPSM